jgi:hypothetical protein
MRASSIVGASAIHFPAAVCASAQCGESASRPGPDRLYDEDVRPDGSPRADADDERALEAEHEHEDDLVGGPAARATSSLALEAARALETIDAQQLLTLLGSPVRARDAGPVVREGGLELAALEAAPPSAAYRGSAAVPLLRALGPSRAATLLVSLLARARGRSEEAEVVRVLEARLGDEAELLEAMTAHVSERSPHLVPLLSRIAPELRLSSAALRLLARASPEEITAALPRLALGLPVLDGKTRRALSRVVHVIAPLHHATAAAVLTALARAGVPCDRRLDGETPIERAAAAGALASLRALEQAGARLGKAKKAKRTKRSARSVARDKPKRAKPQLPHPEADKLERHLRMTTRHLRLAVLTGLAVICGVLFALSPVLGACVTGVVGLTLAWFGRAGRAMRFLRGDEL